MISTLIKCMLVVNFNKIELHKLLIAGLNGGNGGGAVNRLALDWRRVNHRNLRLLLRVNFHRHGLNRVDGALCGCAAARANDAGNDTADDCNAKNGPDRNSPAGGIPFVIQKLYNRLILTKLKKSKKN